MSCNSYLEIRWLSYGAPSADVKVMTLKSPFNQQKFSVSGEMGNSLFSKDVYSPSNFSWSPQGSKLRLTGRQCDQKLSTGD